MTSRVFTYDISTTGFAHSFEQIGGGVIVREGVDISSTDSTAINGNFK